MPARFLAALVAVALVAPAARAADDAAPRPTSRVIRFLEERIAREDAHPLLVRSVLGALSPE